MNKKSQHIVFLTPGFPRNEKDSTTIPALQEYLIALKKEAPNTKMTVIATQYPFKKKEYTWYGYRIIPLNGRNKKIKKIFIWRKALTILKQLHSENSITTIHGFWIGECAYIGNAFAKKHSIKHILTAMGQDVLKPNKHAKLLKKSKTKIITLSVRQSEHLIENFGLESSIIPWGINTNNLPEINIKTIDILGVGSLNSIKNYMLFITIITKLIKTYPLIKVEIIGDGNKKKLLQKQIQAEGLQNTITLIGRVSRNEVLKKMAASKLLLHSSSFESFGLVFIEALHLGMQIVSLNVGIAKKSENWVVCNTDLEMVDAISNLLEKTFNSEIEIPYSIKKTVKDYCKFYDE